MTRAFLGKGWKFPPTLDRGGGVSSSELDESIRESIFIILGTAPGERVMRPNFGCQIHDLVFAPNHYGTAALAATYVVEALEKWEPRITEVEADAEPSPDAPNRLDILIKYKVVANNTSRNLVYPFYLRSGGE
jgi:hypothetical protein